MIEGSGASMVSVILTAGGLGTRMQNNIPKQFLTVNEKPILIYAIEQFQKNSSIDKIVVSCLEEWQPVLRAYSKEFNITKLANIVNGGNTGIESIINAFNILDSNEDDIIIIHDGNRPLVDDDIINRNIESVKNKGATTTYIDIHDGIVKVDNELNIIDSSITRKEVKSTQTPHCFQYKIIKSIISEIDDFDKYISIADAAAKLNYDIELVKGSELNFKITTPSDLKIFDSILKSRHSNV